MYSIHNRNTRLALLTMVIAVPAAAAGPAHHYTLDPGSSAIAKVSFLGLSSKSAGFPKLTGRVVLDPARPQSLDLDVLVDARELTAGDGVTLARLKGANFFDVKNYPTIRYHGTAMTMTGANTANVAGELTVRGVTKPSVLKVSFAIPPAKLSGREAVNIIGTTTIDRRQFGMTAWQMVVGTKVTITLKAQMIPG